MQLSRVHRAVHLHVLAENLRKEVRDEDRDEDHAGHVRDTRNIEVLCASPNGNGLVNHNT
jgi:hypothetical protein